MSGIVETLQGRIEGFEQNGVQVFRGIRYAAPPTGARRFAPPAAPESWTGVRDCTSFGNSAPQPPSPLPGMAPGVQDEDCLFLNVYTPSADKQRRPVMVWIHGGGFTGGSGSQALYEGTRLAAHGQIVLVTLNYRLGALGYLHLAPHADALEAAASNLGQRDQLAALRWVRDNIERFGGDPAQVTIFGESAGGMAVSTLIAMPEARGLFRHAIAQSGAAHATHSARSATRIVEALLDELEIASNQIERLRDVEIARLLEAQVKAGVRTTADVVLPYAPVIEPETLPEHPLDVVRRGDAAEIRLVVGTNRNEWNLFSSADRRHYDMSENTLRKLVRARLANRNGADPDHMIEVYRGTRPQAAPYELFDAIEGDRVFRIPAIRLAEAQRPHQEATWNYSFAWPSPARRGRLGACHAIELPFVFASLDAPTMDRFAGTGPDAEGLSRAMMDAWVSFARAGDPNCDAIPEWTPYCEDQRATMIFDRKSRLERAPDDAERAVWDGIY